MQFFAYIVFGMLSTGAHALDRSVIDASGLPIPRFVSLRSNEINMRVGPGTHYPIKWTYQKKYLPVEIIEEFGHWRRVRDRDGEDGWMHRNLLSGRRSAILLGEPSLLHIAPREDAAVTVKAEQGTLAHLLECQVEWCALEIQSRIGWSKKESLWGVYETEEFSRD